MDNLKKKNVRITSNNWLCPVCDSKKETTTHVFFLLQSDGISLESYVLLGKIDYCFAPFTWGKLLVKT